MSSAPTATPVALPQQPSVLAEVLRWLCPANRVFREPRLGRSARLGCAASASDLHHLCCPGCYRSLGSEASEECRRGCGRKDKWGSDRVQRWVKENRKAPAALGAARRARKEKAWPGIHSDRGSFLGRVGMGNRGTALCPLLLSLVPGVKASLGAQHPLPQPPTPTPAPGCRLRLPPCLELPTGRGGGGGGGGRIGGEGGAEGDYSERSARCPRPSRCR